MKNKLLSIVLIILIEIVLGFIASNVFIMVCFNILILIPILGLIFIMGSRIEELEKRIDNTIPNKIFHSILVKGLKDSEYVNLLQDENWDWEIKSLGNHKYLIDGTHPIAKRVIVETEFIYKTN